MKEYCCDCRAWSHYLTVCIGGAFFSLMLFATIKFADYRFGCLAALAFIYTFYFVLEMINKRVVMTENAIVVQNIIRKKKVYEISDISQIVILKDNYSAYVSIKVAGEKIKILKSQKGYNEFVEELFRRLKVTGYSRGGKRVIEIKK